MLSIAEERMFSLGPRDLASVLSYKNMRFALGKMMYALESRDVFCLFAPDASITRNRPRWLSGYGYGGLIRWDRKDIAFPEIRPNACGMLLMSLEELPEKKRLIDRAAQVNEKGFTVDGIEINPDFGKGNHFLEFYEPLEVSEGASEILPPDRYYAVLHCSGPELKDEMYSYAENGKKVDTPLGKITLLEGEEVEKYYESWRKLEQFTKKRRKLLAERILGPFDPISNLTHQGLFSRGEARLGCYDTKDKSSKNRLFPVALRWNLPVYVFEGKGNLSDEVLSRVGFRERAEKTGLETELKNANILPHGGGYELKLSYRTVDILNTGLGNVYVLSDPEPATGVGETEENKGITEFGKMTVVDPRALPYSYRGEEVVKRAVEFDLSDISAKLRPLMTIKV